MIKATELRLGNFITWNPKLTNAAITLDAMYVEVTEVLPHKIGYTFPNLEHRVEPFEDDLLQTEKRYKSVEELEPIKLTEEVLQKCSFNETMENFKKKYLKKEPDAEGYRYKNKRLNLLIGNLHQLQNLYYFLCGEELDVSL
jgi:hypothetical protein